MHCYTVIAFEEFNGFSENYRYTQKAVRFVGLQSPFFLAPVEGSVPDLREVRQILNRYIHIVSEAFDCAERESLCHFIEQFFGLEEIYTQKHCVEVVRAAFPCPDSIAECRNVR